MKLSTAKDKILRAIVNHKDIYKVGVKSYAVLAALESLAEEKYIEKIELGEGGILAIYKHTKVYPKGKFFVEEKKSFRRIAFWQWVADWPKNYWFVTAFVALVYTTCKPYFYRNQSDIPKAQPCPKRQDTPSSHIVLNPIKISTDTTRK